MDCIAALLFCCCRFNGTIYFIYLVYFTLHTANIFIEVEVMGRELTKTGIQKTEVRKDINKQLGFVYLVSNNNIMLTPRHVTSIDVGMFRV